MTSALLGGRGSICNPQGQHVFFDLVRVWLRDPLTKQDVEQLAALCGGGVHVHNKPMRWHPSYRQRATLFQPNSAALEFLNRRNDVMLTRVEWSLDWTFADEVELMEAWWFVCRHLVRRHRHPHHEIAFVGEGGVTRYSAPRSAPNVLAIYRDRPSKATGEVHCLHFDWRMNRRALRSQGFDIIEALLQADHREFWKRRLMFRRLNLRTFGRRYHNHFHRGRTYRRAAWIWRCGRFEYDMDRRIAGAVLRSHGSLEEVLDTYQKRFDVKDCLLDMGNMEMSIGSQAVGQAKGDGGDIIIGMQRQEMDAHIT